MYRIQVTGESNRRKDAWSLSKSSRKPLFRKSESVAYESLLNAAHKDQLVLSKVKLSDVVEIGSSGLTDAEFNYATLAHLDFVLYSYNSPVMAVEVDCTPKIANDGYFETEVTLVSGRNVQRIGQGR